MHMSVLELFVRKNSGVGVRFWFIFDIPNAFSAKMRMPFARFRKFSMRPAAFPYCRGNSKAPRENCKAPRKN
jgi:hypothetical protein